MCHKRKENGQQSMESPPPLLDASSLAEHPLHLFWLPLPQESPSRCSKIQSEPGQPCQCLRSNDSTAVPDIKLHRPDPHDLGLHCLHCTKTMVMESHHAFGWVALKLYHMLARPAQLLEGICQRWLNLESAGNRNSRLTPHHPLG